MRILTCTSSATHQVGQSVSNCQISMYGQKRPLWPDMGLELRILCVCEANALPLLYSGFGVRPAESYTCTTSRLCAPFLYFLISNTKTFKICRGPYVQNIDYIMRELQRKLITLECYFMHIMWPLTIWSYYRWLQSQSQISQKLAWDPPIFFTLFESTYS